VTPYEYNATVVEVHDGDTMRLDVDLGFHCSIRMAIRIKDLWCAELWTPEGKVAKTAAVGLATPGMPVMVRTHKTRTGSDLESMGRYVADVQLPDGRDFAQAMVAGGWGTATKTG
jgi:endonuclease YncB( thermonuclease family)